MNNDLPAEKTSIPQYEPPSAIVVRLYVVFTIFTLLLVPEIYLFGNFVESAIVRFGGYIGWRRFWMLYLGRIVNDHFVLTLGQPTVCGDRSLVDHSFHYGLHPYRNDDQLDVFLIIVCIRSPLASSKVCMARGLSSLGVTRGSGDYRHKTFSVTPDLIRGPEFL